MRAIIRIDVENLPGVSEDASPETKSRFFSQLILRKVEEALKPHGVMGVLVGAEDSEAEGLDLCEPWWFRE